MLTAPPRTTYAESFVTHVKEHDTWLVRGQEAASIAVLAGSASTIHEVTTLSRTPEFRKMIDETTTEESENLLELLEKRLNLPSREPLVSYSLEEIENMILTPWIAGKPRPDYLLIAESHLNDRYAKRRLQRLMQIAANKGVKTRVVGSETSSGKRLLQFGGIVCLLSLPLGA